LAEGNDVIYLKIGGDAMADLAGVSIPELDPLVPALAFPAAEAVRRIWFLLPRLAIPQAHSPVR
jgi:hypothetical protein